MGDRDRWLDEQERAAWVGVAAVVARLPSVLDAEMKAATGLNHFEYVVLARLSEEPTRSVQLKHLALLANGSLSRLSHVLNRLESRGWVVRQPLPEDGRVTVAVLTASGYDKVVASAPHHLACVRRHVIDPLSRTQVRQLRSVTQSLVPGLYADLDSDSDHHWTRTSGDRATRPVAQRR